jgi:hypothetical protein
MLAARWEHRQTSVRHLQNPVAQPLTSAVKLVFTFYLSFPLAAVLKRIPDNEPWKKNVFAIGYSTASSFSIYFGRTDLVQRFPVLPPRPV